MSEIETLAKQLAAFNGVDPQAPHVNPDGSKFWCGDDRGWFTNQDFYELEASAVLGGYAGERSVQ